MTSVALHADELYRFFRAGDEETRALAGVSVQLLRGEMVAVVGPSGSGKSTLLNCLAGLDNPSGGTVWVDGQRISHQPESVRARLRADHIGMVFQSANLLQHLSVLANIQLSQSLTRATGRLRPVELLASLGLSGRAKAYPAELSGGEAARAALAVALANDPLVLLADEPSGELDGGSEQRLLGLLLDRAKSGKSVLVASHSPAVRHAADRVVTLTDGKVR
jgi:putative ABC transport system ATP-binding protein